MLNGWRRKDLGFLAAVTAPLVVAQQGDTDFSACLAVRACRTLARSYGLLAAVSL
uniref:Uncharacterized protein n=1 Tax=Setaria viridis TaxID=4556 RepID=A0A4U6WK95_SETVI|nr:hypothetical protein SEVIR_1G349950v2 [Setaria viridis]